MKPSSRVDKQIGKQFYNLERYKDATKLLKEYLKYCQNERDAIGESAACYALAQSCLAMNDMENCVASLEAFLELSHNSDYLTQVLFQNQKNGKKRKKVVRPVFPPLPNIFSRSGPQLQFPWPGHSYFKDLR